ncbi:hypothetical protein [Undibacterium sp. CCC3.4]|uniref:hypothetical protein n=1 Tax=Undibacterium sp. CCC3.4 TaxID=3048609 RepID=UPI002AC8CFDC|nr:hypothetical protein [Undibacterium sp. CCC3.4]WPX43071.1 hypothetical protein RHM61_17075 [Undibacterium sp. CCC3.4]
MSTVNEGNANCWLRYSVLGWLAGFYTTVQEFELTCIKQLFAADQKTAQFCVYKMQTAAVRAL